MVSVMGRKPKEENKNITRWPNHLKEIRDTFGVTQEDFSNILNVSRVSISNWENGTGGKMSKNNQEKIAKLFGISSKYIYDMPLDTVAKEAILGTRVKVHLGEDSSEDTEDTSDSNYHYIPKACSNLMPKFNSNTAIPSQSVNPSPSSLLKQYTFAQIMEDYVSISKLVVASASTCRKEELELIIKSTQQVSNRLKVICGVRRDELGGGGDGLQDIVDFLDAIIETTLC